jgi:tetratricopeptide (TPR) repeat protein
MKKETGESLYKPWQVERFETHVELKESLYFDVNDFEEIMEYYMMAGDFKKALRVSGMASRVHPGATSLMLKKAQILAALNREERALKILSEVEILEPYNNDVFLTKGAVFSQMRDYEKAIEEYSKAVGSADEPDYVYCNIAFEYENLGNFDKTIEYLGKALEVNPDNDLAIYEAAFCFDLLSLTEEGISFFNRLIDRHPYSLEAWFNLGVSYINSGQYDKALEALDFAIAIDDDHEHSWFHKGYGMGLGCASWKTASRQKPLNSCRRAWTWTPPTAATFACWPKPGWPTTTWKRPQPALKKRWKPTTGTRTPGWITPRPMPATLTMNRPSASWQGRWMCCPTAPRCNTAWAPSCTWKANPKKAHFSWKKP